MFRKDNVEKLQAVSGTNGAFIRRLACDTLTQPPACWIQPAQDERPTVAYLERAQQLAAEEKMLLCFRRGGGAAIGLQKAETEGMGVVGVPPAHGPDSICNLLQKFGWKIIGVPREPFCGNQLWTFQGMHSEEPLKASWALNVKIDHEVISVSIK